MKNKICPGVIIVIFSAMSWFTMTEAQTITDSDLIEDYEYADIVLKGQVEEITEEIIPSESLTPPVTGFNYHIAKIRFRVLDVLVGEWSERYLPLIALSHSTEVEFDMKTGNTYIISARYSEYGSYCHGGIFILRQASSRFLIEGDRWTRGSLKNPISEGEIEDLYFAIGRIKQNRSVESLVQRADLIMRGEISDIAKDLSLSDDGIMKDIDKVTINIRSLIKGEYESNSIEIKMIGTGSYRPDWRQRVPEIHKGEEWIIFLQFRDDVGFYPFAGVNWMFQIKNGKVIRNNNNEIDLKKNPDEFEAALKIF